MKPQGNKPSSKLESRLKGLQWKLSKRLVLEDDFSGLNRIGGVDQAFTDNYIYSGVVVLDSELQVLERRYARIEAEFPYIPGLLAFREAPPIFKVWRKVERKPGLLLVDGHGIAHPRRLGLASHVGLVLKIPTIGIAKNPLVGDYKEPEGVDEATDLKFSHEVVGKVLKSKKGCNPIFISPGHRVSVETSLETVKKCLRNHKLPEPLFGAHQYANEIKNRSSPNSE